MTPSPAFQRGRHVILKGLCSYIITVILLYDVIRLISDGLELLKMTHVHIRAASSSTIGSARAPHSNRRCHMGNKAVKLSHVAVEIRRSTLGGQEPIKKAVL